MFKKIVQQILGIITRIIVAKHKPQIIGITGSLGKTTTKDAINKVLEGSFDIYAPEKSMNTETGLPITIMRAENPTDIQNPILWLKVFKKGIKEIFAKDYPKILVLEYGVDAPGDMDFLLSIARPSISVITGISEVHMEKFRTLEDLLEEKQKIITKVEGARAVLNTDFELIKDLTRKINNKKLAYGLKCLASDANDCVTATNVFNDLSGLYFNIHYLERDYSAKTGLFGESSVYAPLAAFSVGVLLGMKPKDIVEKLKGLHSSNGRMRLLDGISGSKIIDDSYNSSPFATIKAIETVEKFKGEHRIVMVLGSMNELGTYAEEAHKKVGIKAGEVADMLVTVGDRAERWLAWSARGKGLTKVYPFKTAFEAAEFLKDKITGNDLILIKGSQNNIFTEEVTKTLMDNKYDPKETLVRQTEDWEKIKNQLRKK